MKNIFSSFKLESLKQNLKEIIIRFPIPVFIIVIVSALFFTDIHANLTEITQNNIYRSIFSLIITFFLSIAIYISWENCNFSWMKKNLFQIIPITFWILFFIWFTSDIDNFENVIFFLLTIAGIISYLFFAPYLKSIFTKNIKQSVYYTYFYKISVVFLISTILGWVLFALWNIAIASIFQLFDISWTYHSEMVWDWAVFALSFFTPIYALTQIPNKKTFKENHFNENIFFSFLIKYIAVPFIFIYFIILYAYSVKVLSNFWDWPKWEVSWMVIWFSIFGYLTYIFSYIFEEKNKFIKTFRKAFPYVVIPQLFMLSYAIYLRINQYDITINRYFVVIFGIWLLVISLYYIFSNKKSLSTIPAVLTLFTILISIWPWSIYNLPESRQFNRLVNNIQKAWILEGTKIIPLNNYKDIDSDLSTNIYSWINYTCDFNNCDKIKILFKTQYDELYIKDKKKWEKNKEEKIERYKNAIDEYSNTDKNRVKNNEKILEKTLKEEYEWPSKWEIVDFITDEIKVKFYYWTNKEEERETISFHTDWWIFPVSVKWYSKILNINGGKYNDNKTEYAKINLENKKIELIKNNSITKEINIDFIFPILEKLNDKSWDNKISKENLTFEIDWYKIIFESITIKNPQYKWDETDFYLYANWYLLVK